MLAVAAVSSGRPASAAPAARLVSRTLRLVDRTRGRTLSTTVLYRRGETARPLVVFAHGYDQTPDDYRALLRRWASAGYVVAAPRFPRTVHAAAGGLDATDYRNEPADVRFVIDSMLSGDADSSSPLHGLVDAAHIGVAGHSLGAEVVLGMLNTCCADPRVRAVVSLAGSLFFDPGVRAFSPAGQFGVTGVPLLLVHGDADRGNPYERSRTAHAAASAPKYLLTIIGGDHRRPYQDDPGHSAAARAVARVTVDFLDVYLRGDTAAVARLARDGTVAKVARLESAP